MASDDNGGSVPAREVRTAYQNSLRARQDYRRAVGSNLERPAQERLHDAVFDLFDVLRPVIKNANATEELWSEEKLWPVGRRWIDAAICPKCETIEPSDKQGELCPNPDCGHAMLESGEAPAVDEDGQPVYRWDRGLKTLDGLRDRKRVIDESYDDALGHYSGERVEKELLSAERLLTVADLLDEAMQKLDLLVDIDDDLPKGQLGGVET